MATIAVNNQHFILAMTDCQIKQSADACDYLAVEGSSNQKMVNGQLSEPWEGFDNRYSTGMIMEKSGDYIHHSQRSKKTGVLRIVPARLAQISAYADICWLNHIKPATANCQALITTKITVMPKTFNDTHPMRRLSAIITAAARLITPIHLAIALKRNISTDQRAMAAAQQNTAKFAYA